MEVEPLSDLRTWLGEGASREIDCEAIGGSGGCRKIARVGGWEEGLFNTLQKKEADLFRVGLFVDTSAPRVGARIQRGVTESNSRSRPA
jgi:hypothetical protein